jgi:L-iditol 2-dehydrogenase
MELPAAMDFDTAAMLEPAAVALHAVRQLDRSDVSNVAVIGDGVIGTLAAKWLAFYGISDVSVRGRGDETPASADACIEAVGSAEAFRRCLETVRPNGQIVLVGNPNAAFNLPQTLYWQILRKQLTLRGSWNASFRLDWDCVAEHANKLRLEDCISHRFPFSELDTALSMMKRKSQKHGKVMLTFP